ncbi:sulfurtransferase TusA family protein [Aeromonas dhakensis]|uniref:sulfurtransferase TusA family protein n=1 Tax=Aeromonas dhakensis TaxID=196024 RepID=UPI000F5346B2|nr:sulfurtransferase TusA family protein [Aeromonas dhakensis]RQM87557.1 sulfurtransferase TusA family protein [Aeromonas dhakensis]
MECLDLTPWRCPEPLIRLKLWLRQAKPGQALAIRRADAGPRQDIPAYLQRQGHPFTLQEAPDNTLSLQLVVGARHHSQPQ